MVKKYYITFWDNFKASKRQEDGGWSVLNNIDVQNGSSEVDMELTYE